MFEKVLKGDVSLSVVVEVRIEEAYFICGQDYSFFEEVHEDCIECNWLGEVSQIKLHVCMDRSRVKSSFGTDCSICFFEDGGVLGRDAEYTAREDSILDGILNGMLGLSPGIISSGCEGESGGNNEYGRYGNAHE